MNTEAFYEGMGGVLQKHAFFDAILGPLSPVRIALGLSQAKQDATNEILNSDYAGVARQNPDGSYIPNWTNITRSQMPNAAENYKPEPARGFVANATRWASKAPVIGPYIRKNISEPMFQQATQGLASSPESNKINVNWGKVGDKAWTGIKDWASNNKGLLAGLGTAALGGAALYNMGSGNDKKTVAAPGGVQPAPFTGHQDNFYATDREEG